MLALRVPHVFSHYACIGCPSVIGCWPVTSAMQKKAVACPDLGWQPSVVNLLLPFAPTWAGGRLQLELEWLATMRAKKAGDHACTHARVAWLSAVSYLRTGASDPKTLAISRAVCPFKAESFPAGYTPCVSATLINAGASSTNCLARLTAPVLTAQCKAVSPLEHVTYMLQPRSCMAAMNCLRSSMWSLPEATMTIAGRPAGRPPAVGLSSMIWGTCSTMLAMGRLGPSDGQRRMVSTNTCNALCHSMVEPVRPPTNALRGFVPL